MPPWPVRSASTKRYFCNCSGARSRSIHPYASNGTGLCGFPAPSKTGNNTSLCGLAVRQTASSSAAYSSKYSFSDTWMVMSDAAVDGMPFTRKFSPLWNKRTAIFISRPHERNVTIIPCFLPHFQAFLFHFAPIIGYSSRETHQSYPPPNTDILIRIVPRLKTNLPALSTLSFRRFYRNDLEEIQQIIWLKSGASSTII